MSDVDLTPPVEDAKPKKAKKPKADKPAVEKAPSNRKKLGAVYPEDAALTVLVEGNPKKANTRAHAIFEFYRDAKTVGDFFVATAGYVDKNGKKAPGTYGDISYDVGHGFIKVG